MTTPPGGDQLRLLVVCTANQCRSPMAEALLRQLAGERRAPLAVSSAGLLPGGRPMVPDARAALGGCPIDMSGHRSRQLSAGLVAGADLVVGLARAHLREVVVLVPDAWGRTFTLKELVRRGEQAGGRRPDQPLAHWLAAVAQGRRRAALLGDSPDDDVADPIGGSHADFARTAAELGDLARRLMDLLFP